MSNSVPYERLDINGTILFGLNGGSEGLSAYDALTIPNNVTEINGKAFLNILTAAEQSSIKTLIITENVAKIGDQAFSGCGSFGGTLNIPTKLTNIGIGAFSGTKFNKIICNYSKIPTFDKDSFALAEGTTGSVKNIDPAVTNQALFDKLREASLPEGWTPATE